MLEFNRQQTEQVIFLELIRQHIMNKPFNPAPYLHIGRGQDGVCPFFNNGRKHLVGTGIIQLLTAQMDDKV